MTKLKKTLVILSFILWSLSALDWNARATENIDFSVDGNIRDLIALISKETLPEARQSRVETILELSMSMPEEINDDTIRAIASLLSDPDDMVRALAAAALGYFRSRAKVVVPNMIAAMREKDCVDGGISSSDAIRRALERIGEPPPLRRCP